MDGRKRAERGPENSIGNENGFPHFGFKLGKEKEEEKKKETPEKGKKRDGKCGADWLLSGGPIGKGAEHPQDKKLCPKWRK